MDNKEQNTETGNRNVEENLMESHHEEQKEQLEREEPAVGNAEKTDEKINVEQKLKELNDKYLRLYSEFDNYKKRTAKEKVELSKTAGEEVFKVILPVLDDFERSLKSMNEANDIEALKEGVNLIYHKLKTVLAHKGLEALDALGKIFDPDLHEAITNVPAPSEELKGKVVDELEKGYFLNGKIIRYAKVVVGS